MLKKVFLILVLCTTLLSVSTIMKIGSKERIVFNIPITSPIKVSKTNTIQVEKPIGNIKIPKIGLEKPLYTIDSEKNNVEENVTILKESMNPKDENSIVFIAAHSGTSEVSYFNHLDQLDINDEIELQYENNTYTYQITHIWEQTKDGYIRGRRENKRQLVLTTCCPQKENCQLIINSIEKES